MSASLKDLCNVVIDHNFSVSDESKKTYEETEIVFWDGKQWQELILDGINAKGQLVVSRKEPMCNHSKLSSSTHCEVSDCLNYVP